MIKSRFSLPATVILAFLMNASHGQNIPSATGISGSASLQSLPPAVLDQAAGNQPFLYDNYIRTYVPTQPVQSSMGLNLNAPDDVLVSTTFRDGWGRPVQTVLRGRGAAEKDLVQARRLHQ